MRLLLILYAGDYRTAYQRLMAGEGETYHGHQYAIQSLLKISQKIDDVAVLCCYSKEAYDERLTPGFRVIGNGPSSAQSRKNLLEIISDYQPTHVVLRTPLLFILNWLVRKNVPTITMFADSFLSHQLLARVRYRWMVWNLNRACIQWVSNHGINASYALQQMGVKSDKIIPWDWPHNRTPSEYSTKSLSTQDRPWQLIYVGSVNTLKGVGDLLEAVNLLKHKSMEVRVDIAGKGDVEQFILQAKKLGIDESVNFLGLVPNNTIIERMRDADIVVVPSRHEYPEGFPLTIYEGLCSRTPIVASDHPMFAGVLSHKNSAMVFPAGSPIAMSNCIETLMTNPILYQEISETSLAAWEKLQIPVKWADLIERWLFIAGDNEQWFNQNKLNSGSYELSLSSH